MSERPDYRNDPQWKEFGEAFLEANGNIAEACRRTGMDSKTVYNLKRGEDFRAWLKELADTRFEGPLLVADGKLTRAVTESGSLTSAERQDIKLLYERVGKIQARIESNTTVHNYGNNPLGTREVDDLAVWMKKQLDAARRN